TTDINTITHHDALPISSGAAVARIKSAGLATARFASRSSAKAKPIIREKLARFKPKKKTSSDLPVTYQKEGIADQAKKDSWISSLFKEKFTGEKPGEAFRSGHNIAKKLGGRKLSELKSNEAVQPQIKKKMISAGPKPASLDMTSSSRTNPARPEGLERIDSILTKAPVEQSSTDIQSPVSPNKSIAAGQSSFVDSRRIDDLFSREKARVSPPSPIEPEESTLIKVNSTVPLDREYPKRETAVGALPDFRKIKNAASRFDYSQKLYAILAIIFLLIVPYFIVRWQNSRSKTNDAAVEKAPAQTQLQNTSTPDTKNGASTLNPSSVYSGTGITRLINLNGKIFVVSTGQVVDVQNKKTYPFPGDFGAAKISLGLSDLNLIFFINAKNQMISWSPAAPKFQPENLNLPANATVSYAKTYLTYLYVLDQNNNQVYRYPRTPDGFTDKTDWLKANADLSKAQDMAVNGNVFLTDSTGNLSEYFQGKKQNFQIGATIPPVKAAEVYAHNSDKYIYVLDKTNGRVAKLEANGQIVSQYADATFKKAVDFTVDESTGQIYVTDGTRVESFSMN
ncbi:MAG: hypothetical protein P4L58_01335, partial [Candidatus Pacebacteria bacterium]|nr:hypothetical protein [Candidatus Paceibacterota bacterium]